MRFTPIVSVAFALLLGVLLGGMAPIAIGRALRAWELIVLAAVILALLEWWRGRQLRREREQIEGMRDSALW